MQTSLEIRLLGPFELRVEQQELAPVHSRKEHWLLALLLLRQGRALERDWLAGTLWPESEQSQAMGHLRHYLSGLRKALGPHAVRLQSPTRNTLAFDTTEASIDLVTFDAAIASGEISALEQAVALYRGMLLEGCTEEWVTLERQAREQAYLNALERLASQSVALGEPRKAVGYLEKLIALDPLQENAYRDLMRAHTASGNYAVSVQVYRELQTHLLSELNAEPDTQTTALLEQLRAEARQHVQTSNASVAPTVVPVPAPSAVSVPEKLLFPPLPQPLTPLIGREAERQEVGKWVDAARIVTLTGTGGVGKTRLALQVAEERRDDFPDGVWWLEMEEITVGREMIVRIAEHLRLPMGGKGSVREQTRLALREKNLLLVLDNLEQIPDAAEMLRELLMGTKALKCLVTSRRALGLRGERIFEVAPLPASDSVALFVARAQEGNANFTLAEGDRNEVARLCDKLEGIPLAIELAAARSRTLTLQQMQERLSDRFRLLHSRSPELPPRQRALHAAIEWSYCLLEPPEREVLAQISVFAGGFTLEDAEAVCEADDVFESLEILRSNSLFRAETDGTRPQSRFLMLDSVREYAAQQLEEADETAHFQQRHAAYFLARARSHVEQIRTRGEVAALSALEANADNLYAAQSWAQKAAFAPLNAQLALELGRWRHRRGFGKDATVFVQRGLDALTGQTERYPALVAALLRERAGLYLDNQELATAETTAEQSRQVSAQQQDEIGMAQAENLLGQAAMQQGNFADARLHYARALETFTRTGRTVDIATVQNNLGLTVRRDRAEGEAESRWQRAEMHYQEALRLRTALQDRRGLVETLNNLGVLAFERGDMAAAEGHYTLALAHLRELQNSFDIAVLLSNLGEVVQAADPLRAIRLLTASELFLEEIASPVLSFVATLAQSVAREAAFSPEARQTLRATLQPLSLDKRLELALHGELPS